MNLFNKYMGTFVLFYIYLLLLLMSLIFHRHGLITDVNVPVTEKGKKLGYGFVQFSHPFEAQKAIRQMNEKLVKGRKVAVDWSVRKEQFKDAASDDEEDKSGGLSMFYILS